MLALLAGCQQKDPVVASVSNHKLFASEVKSQIPSGLPAKDSVALASQLISDWITEQLILDQAEKELSFSEKNFDKEMEAYRRSLLKQRYYEKITSDPTRFRVSDDEVRQAIAQSRGTLVSPKDIIQLNYIKLSQTSSLLDEFRAILSDENRRLTEKERIKSLCGDSIEYFIDDDQWLFLEDVELEANIGFEKNEDYDFPSYKEKTVDNDIYLIVLLDYKSKQTGEESKDYFESVRTMLIQKKKTEFLNQHINELLKNAEKKGKIAR